MGTRFEKSSHRIVFHLEHQWWWLPAAAYHLTSSARGTLDTLTQSEFSGSLALVYYYLFTVYQMSMRPRVFTFNYMGILE